MSEESRERIRGKNNRGLWLDDACFPPAPERGYRYFDCPCGHEWIEESRDRRSPSGDYCPKCLARDECAWVTAMPANAHQIARLK